LGVQRQNALILRLIVILVGVGVIVVVLAFAPVVLVLAELVLDYLLSVMLVVLGDPPVGLIAFVVVVGFVLVLTVIVVVLVLAFVVVVVFVLVKDADLLLIPTVARRGGIPPGGRACSANSSRGASARRILAGPEDVPMS
jgi:hypothetical protein